MGNTGPIFGGGPIRRGPLAEPLIAVDAVPAEAVDGARRRRREAVNDEPLDIAPAPELLRPIWWPGGGGGGSRHNFGVSFF